MDTWPNSKYCQLHGCALTLKSSMKISLVARLIRPWLIAKRAAQRMKHLLISSVTIHLHPLFFFYSVIFLSPPPLLSSSSSPIHRLPRWRPDHHPVHWHSWPSSISHCLSSPSSSSSSPQKLSEFLTSHL